MNGRIDEFEIFSHALDCFGRKSEFGDLLIITLIHGGWDFFDEFGRSPFHGEIIGDLFDKAYDDGRCFRGHLRPVLAVNFIAVVFLGIVAGGDHDARNGAEFAHRIREHGNGVNVVKQIGDDPVGGQNFRRGARKFRRFPARIVGNDHAALHGGRTQRFYVFRKSLGGAADGVDVHHVGAVADDAAHSRRAEFQFGAETVFDGLFIPRNGCEFRLSLRIERGIGAPFAIHCFIIHKQTSDFYKLKIFSYRARLCPDCVTNRIRSQNFRKNPPHRSVRAGRSCPFRGSICAFRRYNS